MDETYIGGKTKRRGRPRNEKPLQERFDMVLGMRERKGRVKFMHIKDGKTETIRKAVSEHVDPRSAAVYTDSAAVYQFAFHPWLKQRHRMVNHTIEWIVPDTNTVESSFSLLTRGLIGSFHRVSIKHLRRYLSEFEFRFNVRKDEDRFTTTLRRMAGIAPMPYIELIAVPKSDGIA